MASVDFEAVQNFDDEAPFIMEAPIIGRDIPRIASLMMTQIPQALQRAGQEMAEMVVEVTQPEAVCRTFCGGVVEKDGSRCIYVIMKSALQIFPCAVSRVFDKDPTQGIERVVKKNRIVVVRKRRFSPKNQ
ncbi:hypothetical protein [Asaia astilbis]|uniref:hypothetical protein n=1 Tax=Asaia astilbis TaxID=610244 RepID=UPI001E49DC63|nr:hypothetical protein [Asaia astilbis]